MSTYNTIIRSHINDIYYKWYNNKYIMTNTGIVYDIITKQTVHPSYMDGTIKFVECKKDKYYEYMSSNEKDSIRYIYFIGIKNIFQVKMTNGLLNKKHVLQVKPLLDKPQDYEYYVSDKYIIFVNKNTEFTYGYKHTNIGIAYNIKEEELIKAKEGKQTVKTNNLPTGLWIM